MQRLPGRRGTPDSHLFGPLVHSWPLRTVIEVEQYVLTAAGLHRGEETEPVGQRQGAETIRKTKNCPQATVVKYGRKTELEGEQEEWGAVGTGGGWRRRAGTELRHQRGGGEKLREREKN